MFLLYNLGVYCYTGIIRLTSFFNHKAKLWVEGRREIFQMLAQKVPEYRKVVWFHASSLGEFEQGRPVMEDFREKFPDYFIVLTFFSPSGYEVRKNYDGADLVCYLPADTRRNALRFIRLVHPSLVFFIKYEFWFNYINIIYRNKLKLYFFSVIFRPQQYFFKWYGLWFRNKLSMIDAFFVQDEVSADLLKSVGIQDVYVSGDTRFDRVKEASEQRMDFPAIRKFSEYGQVVIAGSTWPVDEDMIAGYINHYPMTARWIIAPHEIHENRIAVFREKIQCNSLLMSEIKDEVPEDCRVVIVDSIGMLLHLYQYGCLAYIGGGFGKNIHNILEAACFGLPVIFGPNYHKFREAIELLSLGGAYNITKTDQFYTIVNKLLSDKILLYSSSEVCRNYIGSNAGAGKIIMEHIEVP